MPAEKTSECATAPSKWYMYVFELFGLKIEKHWKLLIFFYFLTQGVEDVVNAVLYLLSDKSDMINGTTLPIDGGFLAARTMK